VLGPAKVGRPGLDLDAGFSAAAGAAGLVPRGRRFDAFADEDGFLLGAFLLADVQVTAYRGAVPLLPAGAYLEAATGILATVAAHATVVRTMLLAKGLDVAAGALADGRAGLDGGAGMDRGVVVERGRTSAAPTDADGIAPSRTPGQVLNVLYQSPRAVTSGGFFPWGVNGELNRSDGDA